MAISPQIRAKERLHPNDETALLEIYLSLNADERRHLFISSKTVADNFGISHRTLQRWIEEGYILAIRAGRKYQIYLPTVEDYIAACSDEFISTYSP